MGKIGVILVGIIALFLLIGPFSTPIIDGIHDWRSSDTSQNEVVATAAAVTTANVTLDFDLYQASTGEVQSITSTIEESPVASSYDEDSKVLLVSSLTAETSRTLTINYYAETDDTVMRALGPFLSILIFGGCVFAVMWGMWKGR